jgi:DNA-binding GntR family transcriptional regulator
VREELLDRDPVAACQVGEEPPNRVGEGERPALHQQPDGLRGEGLGDGAHQEGRPRVEGPRSRSEGAEDIFPPDAVDEDHALEVTVVDEGSREGGQLSVERRCGRAGLRPEGSPEERREQQDGARPERLEPPNRPVHRPSQFPSAVPPVTEEVANLAENGIPFIQKDQRSKGERYRDDARPEPPDTLNRLQGDTDLVASVHRELRGRIVRGELAPGARLVERSLAGELAVSRTPVRDAIRRLSREGFVVLNPADRYARPVVAPLTAVDAAELHDIVGWIDAGCAHRAAELSPDRRRPLVRHMARYNETFAAAVAAVALDEALEQDDRFHSAYVRAASGERALAIRREAKPQIERYLRCYLPELKLRTEAAVDEHAEIIRAIAEADASSAHDAALRNWRNAGARLQAAIRAAGEHGLGEN